MMEHELKLSLSAGETLPNSVSWMIEEGYLIAASWTDDQEYTILGRSEEHRLNSSHT